MIWPSSGERSSICRDLWLQRVEDGLTLELSRKYQPDTIELSDTDKQWISYLHAELSPNLGALPQILEHWKLTGASVRNPCTVPEMVTQYLEQRKRDAAPTTLGGMRSRCNRFSAMFYSRKVHEITAADIRASLDTREDRTSKRNDYKELSAMFAWAREQGMLVVSPLAEIKRPRAAGGVPEILTISVKNLCSAGIFNARCCLLMRTTRKGRPI